MKEKFPENVVDLTLALCQFDSTTGKEEQFGLYVRDWCLEKGFQVTSQIVEEGKHRANLLIQNEGVAPSILLTTHLDTVPPFFPAKYEEKTQLLVGRGVADAKGIMAAMMCASLKLRQEKFFEFALLFLAGEETDSDGAKKAANGFAPKVDYFINGEPTDLKLAQGMKGAIVFELETEGKSGHSAYPESGNSAIHQLVRDSVSILEHEWPEDEVFGKTTINIGCIEGGQAPNVIASAAYLDGVIRTTKDADQIIATLEKLVSSNTEVRVLSKSSPTGLKTIPGFETCVVSFGSDIPHLRSLGEPLLIGPGSILKAHTVNESVSVRELEKAVETYKTLCLDLRGSNDRSNISKAK